MALLERVAKLLRANITELIERAENPEVLMKQVILDMRNQLLQVKTQVAMALADQHLLTKKLGDAEAAAAEWTRKAGVALGADQEQAAKTALNRALDHEQLAAAFRQQLIDQKQHVEELKSALQTLGAKLAETEGRHETLAAESRRARARAEAERAGQAIHEASSSDAFHRVRQENLQREAATEAAAEVNGKTADFSALDRNTEIERLLAELRARGK